MTLDTHPCEADGCSTACGRYHFMCLPHWRMVPKALRDEIYAAFRVYESRRRARKLTVEHVKRLRSAHNMAITAVREKEMKKLLKRSEGQPGLGF